MNLKLKEVVPKLKYLNILGKIDVQHEVTKFLESLGQTANT